MILTTWLKLIFTLLLTAWVIRAIVIVGLLLIAYHIYRRHQL
ncbi:hypothetical protein [Lactiplantibacillus pingfangensis]|nr:hypothetical protein [Lactiplantibacillus pingfangensis]